jgi:DUF1680 family protein
MYRFNKRIAFLLLLLLPVILEAQFISLPKQARFSFGDDPGWSDPGFNDSSWQWQQLAKSFKKDSSYGWYRIRVVIPASLKAGNGKGLKLLLGKIDDVDQTWFNGKKIGETGSFPPAYQTQWEKSRLYFIPEQSVKWDQENIIAVRIYNLIGGMGMWEGPYTIEPAGWVDEVDVTHVITDTKSTGFSTKINFTNKSVNLFNGSIQYCVTDKAGKKVIEQNKKIKLKAGAGSASSLRFDGFSPRGESVFNVSYKIKDDNSNLFLKREELHILTADLVIPVKAAARPLVTNKVTDRFTSAPFEQQQFTGYLHTRLTQNLQQRLLKVDEFGLIGSYLKRPGIHPWAGEHIGKYLETAVNTWKLTHDPLLKKQMDRLMFELISTQQSDGYLGTYTPDQYWTSWDVWSHKYNLHGLLAYYSVSGYTPALEACRKIGDLLCRTFGKNPGQSDIILAGEHKGMAATSVLDAMVELYKYTADKKYLDFCYYILDAWQQANGPQVISSILATGKVKNVGNGKAYEMLSNYVGLIKLYQVTGDPVFLKAVELAWQDVVNTQLYITGTSSSHEYFQADDYLPASVTDNMGEGCVTTTWIQLNQQLFTITGDLKYLDQLEKTVYNHLLAAENPQTGCVSYYTPLMGKKPFTCFITCCQSSVPRGIALVPGFTFGLLNNNPTVLLYEPATYKYTIKVPGKKDVGLRLKLDGNFPESGDFMLTVNASVATEIPLSLRVPAWCTQFMATAGKDVYTGTPGQLLTISRKWMPGEQVKIHFDMPIQYLSGGKSYPGQFALQRGPQVLALDKSLNVPTVYDRMSAKDGSVQLDADGLVANRALLPAGWIGKQAYEASILDKTGKIILVPFADASQTEGEIRVWLPVKSKN